MPSNRPPHRPRKGADLRVNLSCRVDPATKERLTAEAKAEGLSLGELLDVYAEIMTWNNRINEASGSEIFPWTLSALSRLTPMHPKWRDPTK